MPYFAKKRPAAHRIAREAAGPLHILPAGRQVITPACVAVRLIPFLFNNCLLSLSNIFISWKKLLIFHLRVKPKKWCIDRNRLLRQCARSFVGTCLWHVEHTWYAGYYYTFDSHAEGMSLQVDGCCFNLQESNAPLFRFNPVIVWLGAAKICW